jgi:hypothetical protein
MPRITVINTAFTVFDMGFPFREVGPEFPIWTSVSHIDRFPCSRPNEFVTREGPSAIAGF